MKEKFAIPWPVIASALFVFIFTNLFSYFVFGHIPRVHDEIDYTFQAKIFKSGRLFVPSPCAKESFDFPHMINNGRWYSQYTPGYPLLLLLGLLIQAPWIINPLLGSLSIFVFYFIGKEIYDKNTGILASILGAASIWLLLMSSTMMSHTSGLFFTSLFILFLFRSIKSPSLANGLFAGIGLGVAFLIRPYNAVLISIPFLIVFALKFLNNFGKRFKNALIFFLITAFFISVLLIYNQITNGHPLRMGYIVAHGEGQGIGFGRTGYTGIPHTPFLGSAQIGKSLVSLNEYLFGWPISSFLALLPLFWINRINKEKRKKDLLLVAGLFSLLVGMYFYWGIQVFIGARMFFEVIPIFILLSAHSISEIPRLLSTKFKKLNQIKMKKVTAGVLIIFIAFAFFIRFPHWIWPADIDWFYSRFDNNFAGVTPNIHNVLNALHVKDALVIMKFLYHPLEYLPTGWWSPGFLYNDPFLKENIIYANDKDESYLRLLQCFPERKIYLYLGTLEKGMLIPLRRDGNKIVYEEPISSDKQGKKYIELLNDPKEFFKIYSHDFGNFLDNLYTQNHFYEIDVARLIELGSILKNSKNYEEATFCFEAALQVEKQPEIRYRILNLLCACYLKTEKKDEAKSIIEKLVERNDTKLYRVFPEKGF